MADQTDPSSRDLALMDTDSPKKHSVSFPPAAVPSPDSMGSRSPTDMHMGPAPPHAGAESPVYYRDVQSHLKHDMEASWTHLEAIETAFFEWRIQSWSEIRQNAKVHSDYFECHGQRWRLLLFPNGNNVDTVSVFLEMDKGTLQADQSICAQFFIGIRNPHDEAIHFHNMSNHRFDENTIDWGFNRFYSIADLTKPVPPASMPSDEAPPPRRTSTPASRNTTAATTPTSPTAGTEPNSPEHTAHELRPLLENDQTILYCCIRVFKDETGVLWHNFVNYDSKKATGYVGLKNQGATCYMNSILQSLFCTNLFRKAVYQIPFEPADHNHSNNSSSSNGNPAANGDKPSVTVALQRLFYFMQTHPTAVGTNELTRSFGWNTRDSFAQHDVQEFNRVLTDNLEEKMKGTPADGSIQALFVGKMKSYIRCINVDYESSRIEDYYDIQLNVKGCKTLEDSFKDYIQVETLDGENKYKTDDFGLQDAKKGVIFEKTPPVLHLQLKRFDYDMYRDMMVKINDRFEFPEQFDFEPYLSDSADQSQPHRYHLHGVLVHSGSLDAGHYFAFIKPTIDGKWLRFDDDKVIPVTLKEVLDESYGGELSDALGPNQKGTPPPRLSQRAAMHKRFTNAYMLVYIRESERDKVLAPIITEDVPHHILEALEKERQAEELREREIKEREFMLNIRVIDDSNFREHSGLDLANFDNREMPLVKPVFERKFHKQDTTWAQCKATIAQELGQEADKVRFWVLTTRKNKTLRPDSDNLLQENHDELTLDKLKQTFSETSAPYEIRLYMERPANFKQGLFPPPNRPGAKAEYALIFVKVYLPLEGKFSGLGHFIVQRFSPVKELFPQINEALGWPANTPLLVWEEIFHKMVEAVQPNKTWHAGELGDGDILCVQKDYPKQEMESWPKKTIRTALEYYNFMNSQVTITFRPHPKLREEDKPHESFSLVLSRNQTYDDVAEQVAEKISLADPTRLRLWSTTWNDQPKTAMRPSLTLKLAEMFTSFPHNMNAVPTLIYEVLDMSITELETKRLIKVSFMTTPMKEDVYELLVPRTGTVQQVLEALKAKLKDHDKHPQHLRLYEVSGHRLSKEFTGEEPVNLIQEYISLYAEDIPEDEVNLAEGDKVITCIHINKYPMSLHGVPFKFVAKKGETFVEAKKRMQERLGLGEKEFARITFTIAAFGALTMSDPVDDKVVLADQTNWASYNLALDHPERRTARSTGFEKAIKIFN